MVDGAEQTWKKYSVEDITAALDDVPRGNQEVRCALFLAHQHLISSTVSHTEHVTNSK